MTLWDRTGTSPLDATLPNAPSGYVDWRVPAAEGLVHLQPDGTLRIVETRDDGMAVVYWDIDRGEAVRTIQLNEPGVPITQVAESPDGAFLAGQDRYGRLFVWDLATGELIGDPVDRPDLARTIAFHPAVPTMLTIGLAEGGIAFYDVSTERQVGDPLMGHGTAIRAIAFTTDGRHMFSVGDRGLVGRWGVGGAGGLLDRHLAHGVTGPESSVDGSRMLVTVNGDRLEVRDGADPAAPAWRSTVHAGRPCSRNRSSTTSVTTARPS